MHIYIHHLSFYRASDVADLWWCTAKLASHRYTVCWMPWKANPRSPLQVSQLSWFRFMLALLQYKQASRTRICICLQTTSPSVLLLIFEILTVHNQILECLDLSLEGLECSEVEIFSHDHVMTPLMNQRPLILGLFGISVSHFLIFTNEPNLTLNLCFEGENYNEIG